MSWNGWRSDPGWGWVGWWPHGATEMSNHHLCSSFSLGVLAFHRNIPSPGAGPPQVDQTWLCVTLETQWQPILSPSSSASTGDCFFFFFVFVCFLIHPLIPHSFISLVVDDTFMLQPWSPASAARLLYCSFFFSNSSSMASSQGTVNDENTLAGFGPENRIGCYNFRLEGELAG